MTSTQLGIAIGIWMALGVLPLITWRLARTDAFTLLELLVILVFGCVLGPLPILLMLSHKVVLRKARK